jgi:hypothetical protein
MDEMMVINDFGAIDGVDCLKFTDVHEKVTSFMVKVLNQYEFEQKLVNWFDFFDEMHAYWGLPEITILKAMKSARLKTTYKLAGDFDIDNFMRLKNIKEEDGINPIP